MHRTIKSFVLRAGRMSPRQQHGLEQGLSRYQLLPQTGPWDLAHIFGRAADTILEIGFGMGHSLVQMAQDRPDLNFIGVEVHLPGIGSLVADLQERQIYNVRIAGFDAVEVLQTCIADDALMGFHIFFPDPWPKKRHHKRRLIQPHLIERMIKKLKVGGTIHCATDWQDYADHMQTVLSAFPQLKNSYGNGQFAPRPESRPLTKFEQRGQRLGHGVWDLMFIKLA